MTYSGALLSIKHISKLFLILTFYNKIEDLFPCLKNNCSYMLAPLTCVGVAK